MGDPTGLATRTIVAVVDNTGSRVPRPSSRARAPVAVRSQAVRRVTVATYAVVAGPCIVTCRRGTQPGYPRLSLWVGWPGATTCSQDPATPVTVSGSPY